MRVFRIRINRNVYRRVRRAGKDRQVVFTQLTPEQHIERLASLIQRQDQRQPQARFTGGDRQNEDREDLSLWVAVIATERRQINRNTMQHQLGRKHDQNQIASR